MAEARVAKFCMQVECMVSSVSLGITKYTIIGVVRVTWPIKKIWPQPYLRNR